MEEWRKVLNLYGVVIYEKDGKFIVDYGETPIWEVEATFEDGRPHLKKLTKTRQEYAMELAWQG